MARFLRRFLGVPTSLLPPRPAILVAESEPDLCRVLGHLLHDAAYDAVFATDAVAALRALARDVPDVLVLDFQLPQLDGLLTLELVRAIAGSVPVVLLSTVAGPGIQREAERLGVLAIISKPFRNVDLLDAVARGLALGRGVGLHAERRLACESHGPGEGATPARSPSSPRTPR